LSKFISLRFQILVSALSAVRYGSLRGTMHILIIRPAALGDVLLTLPALQALSAAYPSVAIELMGNLPALHWLPGRSVVHTVSSFDRADLAALFQPDAVPAAALQAYLDSFDLILSYATAREHVFARNLSCLARGRVLSYDARPQQARVHMSQYLQQPLAELGIAPVDSYPGLHLTAADQGDAAQWWAAHNLPPAPVVAIHPGSGSPAKNWSAERFAALASRLQTERGARILLLSGPADEAALDAMRECLDDRHSTPSSGRGPSSVPPPDPKPILLHDLPLPLLAAILSRCGLYVGNDSGVSHLAAALGVPTVAIFGPTDPAIWAPRGPAVRIVRTAISCAPCSPSRRQSCRDRLCLDSVLLQQVLDVAHGYI